MILAYLQSVARRAVVRWNEYSDRCAVREFLRSLTPSERRRIILFFADRMKPEELAQRDWQDDSDGNRSAPERASAARLAFFSDF